MIPTCDYHIHTPLCGHASGQLSDYVKTALSLGLGEIGFSDHAPLLSHRDPEISMDRDDLPLYHRLIEGIQRQFQNQLIIKIGIEADFFAPYAGELETLLRNYPYDYVIGSVHFIEGWGFDDPSQEAGWKNADIDRVYDQYYECLKNSARSRLFDIMAHVDLVKKFGHRASQDMTGQIRSTAQTFKECGVTIEINTSGLRKPVGEIYPHLEALKIYCQCGVPMTFGSDAHEPGDVGRDFDLAVRLAKEAGYKQYAIFKQRKIERFMDL